MKRLAQKLNCRRGASMLMALLLMLVGIMVSAVIISAATSAAVTRPLKCPPPRGSLQPRYFT